MNLGLVEKLLRERGEKPFRFTQLKHAAVVELVSSWAEVSTIKKDLRDELEAKVPISCLRVLGEANSDRGDSSKVVFGLPDGRVIETVLMEHTGDRNTVCVSSQAGCAMHCAFCATGAQGFKRNLTSEEIADQVFYYARKLKAKSRRVSNVVIMGMGEPFGNYDNVLAAVRIWNDPDGLNISARKITISTCGVVPGILRLADEPLQLNLAISLHAPTTELRDKLMPVNKAYLLPKLMAAIETYVAKTNRKVLFEYVMLDGVNDSMKYADELAKLMHHPLYQVNLIKYHATGFFDSTPAERRAAFKKRLEDHGIVVTARMSFGEDIKAACGQLAGEIKNN